VNISSASWNDGASELTVDATGDSALFIDFGTDTGIAKTGNPSTVSAAEYAAYVRVYSAQGESSFTPVANPPAGGGGGTFYHPAKDHSASINTATNCTTTCHTPTGNAIVTGTHSNTCATCHASPATEVINAIYDGFDGTSTPTCVTCHERSVTGDKYYNTDFAGSHTVKDHTDNIATTPLCVNCHTGADLIVDVHNNNCEDCHTDTTVDGSTDGTLHDGETAASYDGTNVYGTARTGHVMGGSRTCAECHSGYFENHSHTHTMAEPTLCTSCHLVSGGAPYVTGDDDATYEVAIDNVHNVDGCATCHDTATDGSLKVGSSAEGAVSGDGCQDCHSGYFDGHGHDHSATGTSSVLGPVDTSTFTLDCLTSGCHIATIPPYVGTGEVHNAAGTYANDRGA
jgi:hypothetical protein